MSNCEPKERFGRGSVKEFQVTAYRLPRGEKISLLATGCKPAIGEPARAALCTVAHHFTGADQSEALMRSFVKDIRLAAGHVGYGHLVGMSCMGQLVPHASHAFEFQHFDAQGRAVRESPIMISPPGIVCDQMRHWEGEANEIPPGFPFLEQ